MVSGMPYSQARKEKFRGIVKSKEENAGGKDRLQSAKLTVKGTTSLTPIYQFDLNDLAYNKSNGRIKAEIIEKEAELGRTLNQFDESDSAIISEILLSIRKDENEKIKEDLRKNTQIFPGIITVDGIVINGNRRKALLTKLFEETHDERFKYLDAHILPSDIKKQELWLIEAGIQLSAPQQLDYSPINNLLKLREGIISGLSIADMASRIYGTSDEKIKTDLDRLDLIDEYLADFINKPGKYYLVKNLDNHFINLVNILNSARNPRGVKKDWTYTEDDINELKLVAFYYIRMHMPHLQIRELRKLFFNNNSWLGARRVLEIAPDLSEEEREKYKLGDTKGDVTAESVSVDDDDDNYDDTSEEVGATTATEQIDSREEAIWAENRRGELKAIFEDSVEIRKIQQNSEKPLVLAQRALNNIQGIPEEGGKLTDPEIDKVLSELILQINRLRKEIKTTSK